MSKKKKDDELEKMEASLEEETTAEEEMEEEEAAEESVEEDEAEEEEEKEEKPHKSNIGLLVAEGVIAVAAIGFIGFAIGSSVGKHKNSASENMVSENVVSEDFVPAEIDNSDLEALRPATPSADAYNTISEKEAKDGVADGTMMELTLSTGEKIYIPNYENEELMAEMTAYTEEDLDKMIYDNFLSQLPDTEMQVSEKTLCEDGDTVSINYVGRMDGEEFQGGSADNSNLKLGSNSFIAGFEEGLVGANVGDTVVLNLTFPEDYYEELAGKDVEFTVTINSIMLEPVLTDELVASYFPDLKTVEDCREFYREQLIMNAIYKGLTEKVYETALNEDTVTMYYDYNIDYYCTMYSMYYGMSLSDVYGEDVVSLLEDVNTTSGESVFNGAIFRAIAAKEKVQVTDADIEKMATDYGYASSEEFMSYYDKEIIDDAVLVEKTLKAIKDKVTAE